MQQYWSFKAHFPIYQCTYHKNMPKIFQNSLLKSYFIINKFPYATLLLAVITLYQQHSYFVYINL